MGFDQSFDIQSTFKANVFVCTTGISSSEKRLLRSHLPQHMILEDVLTTNTNYLVTYRAMMTDKYVQALKWSVKIVNIKWLYDVDAGSKKYEMLCFEGSNFTTSEISNEIFINYYCLLGAKFKKNATISTDFLVSDSDGNEKIDFCRKYEIPVIAPGDVFKSNYDIYKKQNRFEAMRMVEGNVFDEKVFFLDPSLPKMLFNGLRRMIIENGGTRVSSVDKDVEFILTFSYDRFAEHKDRIYHYQYVFDCVESRAVLYPEPYRVYPRDGKCVLGDAVCCIDCSLGENRINMTNKLKALGAVVKTSVDLSCTHLVIKDKKDYKRNKKTAYKVVLSEWIDQCLYTLRHVREDKYLVRNDGLNLIGRRVEEIPMKKVKCTVPKMMLFQFTGLSSFLRNKAMERLDGLNVRYSESDKYEGCTHLIMGSVSTSEKFLSCLCNGGWILRPDVINVFDNSPGFGFSRYEWVVSPDIAERDRKMIAAVRKWRERIEINGKAAFYKWIVKLYCDDGKRDNYTRVIENGGGAIATGDDYTHCFVSKQYSGQVSEEKRYSTDYIFSYLFQ